MSQHQAVKFLQAGTSDPKLAEKLSKAPRTIAGWLPVAASAGFTFTQEDMTAVAEKLLQSKVAGDPIQALTAKQAELSDEQLAGVAGGVDAGVVAGDVRMPSIGLSSTLVARVQSPGSSRMDTFPDQWIRGGGGMPGGSVIR